MKDCIIIVVVGLVLGLVFFRPLGELIDKDNGDYIKKKHEQHIFELIQEKQYWQLKSLENLHKYEQLKKEVVK